MPNIEQSPEPAAYTGSLPVAIVTGANDGIGLETTVGLAEAGYHVVMACRSRERAEAAVAAIVRRAPAADLQVMLLDLSSQESVRKFAEEYRSRYQHLDLLINNAGIMDGSRRRDADGNDLQFATNHLGHFLLASLLIDRMPDRPSSRVTSLSSVAHRRGRIHFDDLSCSRPENARAGYAQSKVACLIFAIELNRRLRSAGSRIVSVAAHPGVSLTALFKDAPPPARMMMRLLQPIFMQPPEEAAKPTLHAALDPNVRGGEYYGPQKMRGMKGPVGHAYRTAYSDDPEVARRLWEVSEELTRTTFELPRPKGSAG